MLLNVDDFGCVPDGRFLEKVSIQAGSTVLGVADGTVRPTDVGKRIAIPGAVDLVATISGLIARKDVASTSMVAGSATLTAVLTAQEGFFQDAFTRACASRSPEQAWEARRSSPTSWT
jgi:hypothetical protein